MWFDDAGNIHGLMKHSRKLVLICCGSDCKKEGAKGFYKSLKKEFKNQEYKGKYKLIKTHCLDMCKSAPVAVVQDHFFKKVEIEKLLDHLKKP